MPFRLGTTELIILLVIVVILFGVGRIGKLGAELGKGIRELRKGISPEDETSEEEKSKDTLNSEGDEKS